MELSTTVFLIDNVRMGVPVGAIRCRCDEQPLEEVIREVTGDPNTPMADPHDKDREKCCTVFVVATEGQDAKVLSSFSGRSVFTKIQVRSGRLLEQQVQPHRISHRHGSKSHHREVGISTADLSGLNCFDGIETLLEYGQTSVYCERRFTKDSISLKILRPRK